MSTATAEAPAAAPAKGKKKLIIIVAVAALVLAVGGGGAVMMMKKKAADAEATEADGDEHAPAEHAAAKHDSHAVPTFVPLDPFTVNLADRDAERYAQVGITLEIEDAHLSDQIKNFMPAIRNNILMAIADRTAAELLGREGKAKLADRIKRETSKALGFEVEDESAAADDEEKAAKDDDKKPKKKKKKAGAPALPVKAVHFSNFIIQ